MDRFLRYLHKQMIEPIAMMSTTARVATPPIMAAVTERSLVLSAISCAGEHAPSPSDEIATEHSESTVTITPVRVILAPLLTHSSIREMSEPLSVLEVPSSLARYIRCVGDSEKQAIDCCSLSMMSLVIPHSAHEVVSCCSTAPVISSSVTSLLLL